MRERRLNFWNDYQKLLLYLIDLVVVFKPASFLQSTQMNANVLNGQVTTCMIRLQTCFKDQIWNLYLSLVLIDIEIIFWGTQVLWHLYYSSSFKTGLGLKLSTEKKIGSFIWTARDMKWHSLVWRKIFLQFLAWFLPARLYAEGKHSIFSIYD